MKALPILALCLLAAPAADVRAQQPAAQPAAPTLSVQNRSFDGLSSRAVPTERLWGARLGLSSFEFALRASSTSRGTLLGAFDVGQSQGLSIDLNTDADDAPSPGSTRFFLRDASGPEQAALSATFADDEASLYDGRLHHLLFTYDANAPTQQQALRAYVDGSAVELSFAPNFRGVPRRFQAWGLDPTLGARNARGVVGNAAGGESPLALASMAIYARALSPGEAGARARALGIKPRALQVLGPLVPLRQADARQKAAFDARSRRFLSFVAAHAENPMATGWGPYRCFDGYALACLALGNHDAEARRLLGETLDMIERNLAGERRGGDKWHLADFAIHPLLRAYFQLRPAHFPNDPLWARLESTAQNFLLHFGDLSENHNLLHLALRYLAGQTWPEAVLSDGRKASVHYAESGAQIRQWMRDWVRRGSAEWGSDIYYNVNLLALLNLYDFARDPAMKLAAQGTLDLFALDEALDAFAGSAVGAARRGYAVYRMDVRQSPARALHYLWFAPRNQAEPFNLNFIGGAIEAASSKYLPPPAIVWIANQRAPLENRTTHLRGLWGSASFLGKHTLRLSDVMQSTMDSPGARGGYTEQVWQVTMSEQALIFANHPTLSASAGEAGLQQTADRLRLYESTPAPAASSAPSASSASSAASASSSASGAWYWIMANVPPGHAGDVRPGYWQGNRSGPRSFGMGALSFLIFDIPPGDALPWAHIYLPRARFDEVREESSWIYARRGSGYVALWIPGGYEATSQGFWSNTELKLHGSRAAVLSFVGDAAREGSFAQFMARTKYLQPRWDAQNLVLSALPMPGGERLSVSYAGGPSLSGRAIQSLRARFDTPWGSMPLGSMQLQLSTPVGQYKLDLRRALR